MKLMLFLGSGTSRPTGLPLVGTITDKILNGEWHSHTDSNFYPGFGGASGPDLKVARQQQFLALLKESIDDYHYQRRNAHANYEDLYYLVRQIEDELLGEIDNPAVQDFVSKLKRKTTKLCRPNAIESEFTLCDLAGESQRFISSAVWHLLKTTDTLPKGLNAVADLAQSAEITKLDIATLNHDVLVETLFSANNIPFADGFSEPDGEVRFFAPDVFDQNNRTNLYKLHGSIGWWRFSQDHGRPTARGQRTIIRYGIPLKMPPWSCENSRGDRLSELDPCPVFLCGSYNKLFDYRYGIFADLHFRFFRLLREHDTIVMSGYGWNVAASTAGYQNGFPRRVRIESYCYTKTRKGYATNPRALCGTATPN